MQNTFIGFTFRVAKGRKFYIMESNDLLKDTFKRIKDIVTATVKDTTVEELTYRPSESANSIAWLVWHLTRIQDNHISDLLGKEQVWKEGWSKKFDLPFPEDDTGYGHKSKEVGYVRADSKLLLDYFMAVYDETIKYIDSLKEEDYKKVVDKRWDPPVTLGVRLISVISDDLQHAGQAAYVKGLTRA